MAVSLPRPQGDLGLRLLLDTNVLSEPLCEKPNEGGLRQLELGDHQLCTASVVIRELIYGLHRLAPGRKQQRLASYNHRSDVWHGEQRARLDALGRRPAFADGQISAIASIHGLMLITGNERDFTAFEGLQILNWFLQP